jgi:hypothetical protein
MDLGEGKFDNDWHQLNLYQLFYLIIIYRFHQLLLAFY